MGNDDIEDGPRNDEEDLGHHTPGERMGRAKGSHASKTSDGHLGRGIGHLFHGHIGKVPSTLRTGRGAKQREEEIVPTLTSPIFTETPTPNNYNRR